MTDGRDDDDAQLTTQVCVDCRAVSPPINTNYTLIGSHEWRVTRTIRDGKPFFEWRCPTCWLVYKGDHGDDAVPSTKAGRSRRRPRSK